MKLFHKYQSRSFQFALSLLARLEHDTAVDDAALQAIARKSGLDYAEQIVKPLCQAGILEREGKQYRLAEDVRFFCLPPGQLERDCLRFILDRPEARLFLTQDDRRQLDAVSGDPSLFCSVQRFAPSGQSQPPELIPEHVQTLLQAIRQRRYIRYTYRTRDNDIPQSAETLPWKLEYSVYDQRWWIILYHPREDRTIKARLENLRDIRLLEPAGIPDDVIRQAMERLLEPEPVVLQVQKTKNALERCFLVFENQMFLETRQVSEDCWQLSFQYYRFDRGEILRRLLYLGPAVTLLSPAPLREELGHMLDRAIALAEGRERSEST